MNSIILSDSIPDIKHSQHKSSQDKSEKLDDFINRYLLPFGLFIQLTAITWLGKGGATTQTYIWLILPAFLSALLKLRHFRFRYLEPGILECTFLLFVAWAALSWCWSDTEKGFGDLLMRCLCVILYVYAIIQCARNWRGLEKLLLLSAVVVTSSAAVALINHYLVLDYPLGYRSYRLFSMGLGKLGDFKHPVNAGIFYGAYAVILFTWLCTRANSRLAMTLATLGISILSCYVTMTWSRGPIIALVVSFILISVLVRNKTTNRALCTIALMALFIGLTCSDLILSPTVLDPSLNHRTAIWQAALDAIRQSPLVGYGFGHQQKINILIGGQPVAHAHSLPLQMILNYGVVGVSLLVVMAVSMLLTIKQFWNNPLARYALALILFGGINMVTDVSSLINRPGKYWLVTWLPLALVVAARRTDPSGNIKIKGTSIGSFVGEPSGVIREPSGVIREPSGNP